MTDMNAVAGIFLCHRLGESPQPGLRRVECAIAGSPPQRSARGSGFPGQHSADRLAAEQADCVRPATTTFNPSAANRLHNWAPTPRFGPTPITTAVFISHL